MKVLLTGTSFLPSYGGPAFSVSRLGLALVEQGATVAIWAPDGSAASTPLLSQDDPLLRLTGSPSSILRRFGLPDVLHDNGIWLRHNHKLAKLAAQRRVPRIVSLRGMLEPWAVSHRSSKKKVAWTLYQRRDLLQAAFHHTTAEAEASHLAGYCLGVPIRTIPNGVEVPETKQPSVKRGHERRALYLGRLHPVKGLPMLIAAWAAVRPSGWVLDIAGPDEDGHRSTLERLVRDQRLGDVVKFHGPIGGASKSALYWSSDLLYSTDLLREFWHGRCRSAGSRRACLDHEGCSLAHARRSRVRLVGRNHRRRDCERASRCRRS